MSIGAEVAIPDVVEPIVGFRSWAVSTFGLVSGPHASAWPVSGPLKATCQKSSDYSVTLYRRPEPPHAAPARTCDRYGPGCGIYAYRDLADLVANQNVARTEAVFGEVELWGVVYEHEHGYRAEYARLKRLFRYPQDGVKPVESDLPERVARVYQVPLIDFPMSAGEISDAMAAHAERVATQNLAAAGVSTYAQQAAVAFPALYAPTPTFDQSLSTEPAPPEPRRSPLLAALHLALTLLFLAIGFANLAVHRVPWAAFYLTMGVTHGGLAWVWSRRG